MPKCDGCGKEVEKLVVVAWFILTPILGCEECNDKFFSREGLCVKI